MPKATFLDELRNKGSVPKRLAKARSEQFCRSVSPAENVQRVFPTWLGCRVSCDGPPPALSLPHKISWSSRVLDTLEAERFCAWVQSSQVAHGLMIAGPCSWCGLPTGDFCEWCPLDSDPATLLCSTCGWRIGQCRLCRILHLQDGLRTVKPPSGSATFGTHRCATCGRQGVHLQHCQGCLVVRYCNRECQKKDWNEHKLVCKYLKGMVAPVARHLHFIYPWQLRRVPVALSRLPHGICERALMEHNSACMQRQAATSVAAVDTTVAACSSSDDVVILVDDYMYKGISLTDGMGFIGPELLRSWLKGRVP